MEHQFLLHVWHSLTCLTFFGTFVFAHFCTMSGDELWRSNSALQHWCNSQESTGLGCTWLHYVALFQLVHVLGYIKRLLLLINVNHCVLYNPIPMHHIHRLMSWCRPGTDNHERADRALLRRAMTFDWLVMASSSLRPPTCLVIPMRQLQCKKSRMT